MTRIGAWASTAVLCLAARAHADASSDAKDLFERGRQLRAAGDCAAAAPLFEKAYALFPSALGPLRNAAECEESTGRWATARRSWLELKRAMVLSNDPKYTGWDADADSAAKRLAPRVSHLMVDVTMLPSTSGVTADPSKLDVRINGEALEPALVGTTLDRDPGTYIVRARVGEGEAAEQKIDLVTGEARTLRLIVAPSGQPLPKQPPQPRAVVVSSSPLAPAGWISVALGGAAFVAMGIAIGVRQDALSTLTQMCPAYATASCARDVQPTVDRGSAASTAVTALAIGGSIVAGAGIVLLVLDATQRSTSTERRVSFGVSPFGANLLVRFQ